MTTLKEYKAKIDTIRPRCGINCNQTLTSENLEMYPHGDGWNVDGKASPQWLYLHCPKCGYDKSLWKIGINRPDGELDEYRVNRHRKFTG